jgi:hypothetical protein
MLAFYCAENLQQGRLGPAGFEEVSVPGFNMIFFSAHIFLHVGGFETESKGLK